MFDLSRNIITSSNYSSAPKINDSIANTVKPVLIGREITKSPVLSFFGPRVNSVSNYTEFTPHEYDLYEYSRIIDTEAIVYKAFERKKSLMFKNGYLLTSDSDDNISYIKQRLKEFHYVSGKSFDGFVEELAYNLIMFHNAYVLMYRDLNKSTGEPISVGDEEIELLAALFNMPTESIERKLKDDGSVSRYKQKISYTKYRTFSPKIIRHLTYNKRPGFTMGTPPLEAVKDDIIALRRIEESVETLIYKSLFPIIHVKVGTESHPATTLRDGSSEVSAMSKVLKEIDDSGGVVTSERVEIKSIGAESMALRVESYLEYFKNRVMIGLGVSTTDLGIGDSSGKATGSIISQTLKEAVIDMQRVVARFITEEIFSDLLVESGKYKAKYMIPEEEMVTLSFNSVDHDSQIKIESHWLNLANSKMISQSELRALIGKRPMSDDEMRQVGQWEENTASPSEVENVKANTESSKASAKAAVISVRAAAKAKTTSTSGSKQNKKSGANNSSKAKTNPKNQYSDSEIQDSANPVDQELGELVLDILDNLDDVNMVQELIASNIKSAIDINNIHDNVIVDSISKSKAEYLSTLNVSKLEDAFEYVLDEIIEAHLSTGLI